MDLVLICLRNPLQRAHVADGQICNEFGIHLLKKSLPGEPRSLTDRFVMYLLLICLRNRLLRAQGSDGQICNGFGIDLHRKLTPESPGL